MRIGVGRGKREGIGGDCLRASSMERVQSRIGKWRKGEMWGNVAPGEGDMSMMMQRKGKLARCNEIECQDTYYVAAIRGHVSRTFKSVCCGSHGGSHSPYSTLSVDPAPLLWVTVHPSVIHPAPLLLVTVRQ